MLLRLICQIRWLDEDQEEEEDSVNNNEHFLKWPRNSLTHRVMRTWEKRKDPLVHSYSLVGHLCSPNSVIIEDVINAMSTHGTDYKKVVEDLVKKLLLDLSLIEDQKKERLAHLMEEIWTDLNHFQNCTGPYNRDHVWIT